jgi:hypothetical protein
MIICHPAGNSFSNKAADHYFLPGKYVQKLKRTLTIEV